MSLWHGDPRDFPPGVPIAGVPTKVIDLAAARDARTEAAGTAAHDRGDAFSFELHDDLAEDDAPIGHAGGVVTLLLDTDALTGIALSPAAARRLATALIDLAHLAENDTPC